MRPLRISARPIPRAGTSTPIPGTAPSSTSTGRATSLNLRGIFSMSGLEWYPLVSTSQKEITWTPPSILPESLWMSLLPPYRGCRVGLPPPSGHHGQDVQWYARPTGLTMLPVLRGAREQLAEQPREMLAYRSANSQTTRLARILAEKPIVNNNSRCLSTGVQKFDDVFSRAYAATAVRDSRASTRLRRRLRSRRVNFHWNGVAASW